jgi:uncharacterized phage-associated protein
MKTHYIILSSCYAKGCRIAMDTTNVNKFKNIKQKLFNRFGKSLPISTHIIPTNSVKFASVIEVDRYFDDVKLIRDYRKFASLIALDRKLSGLDVALYVLAKEKCSHFKLEKLTYLCYAEYLCKYNEPMFVDKIYAYQYGPIIKSVLNKFGKKYDASDSNTNISIASETLRENFTKSRILNADNGINILYSIEETLEKYGKMSANKLIKITHSENSPWEKAGCGKIKNSIITDELIKKYHCNEV